MKIVDNKTGGKPTMVQILLRLLGYVISACMLFAGFLWIGVNKRRRAWHDYLSDTVVVTQPWRFPIARVKAVPYPPKEETHETPAD
ncbi:MAG: RDD family protein, partial [Rickettsiales bacterium]|nr:RDD family protein [Rickettsiales bacterium]